MGGWRFLEGGYVWEKDQEGKVALGPMEVTGGRQGWRSHSTPPGWRGH